jgi:apolipoprotein N-acyltransferase
VHETTVPGGERASPDCTAGVPPLILAIVSGLLLALSFPRYGHPAMAWAAATPLLVALWLENGRVRLRRAFMLGLATGGLYFGGTVYWTSGVMARYGGINSALSVAIAGLLVAYLALFVALAALAIGYAIDRFGPRGLLLTPAAWVAAELGRTVLFGGFPWALVGYTQVSVLPIAQIASVVGVYGLSFLVLLASACLGYAVIDRGRAGLLAVTCVAVLVFSLFIWGRGRLARGELTHAGTPLRVGLVQGNIPQDLKWTPGLEDDILGRYLALSREAADRGARAILWPESSTPFYFEESPKGEAIRLFAREHGVWMLLGSDELDRRSPRVSYNSAFLVQPDGRTAGVYRKVRLVPFGEYVPFKRLLFFAAPLVEAVGEFAPGEAPIMLPLAGYPVSTAICYEVVYPALIREGVLQGSTLLTTITNDAWFGRSSAPYQHFEMASMRAIEQGRYLARAANTGISGIVDPYGRVLMASNLFISQVLVGDVRLIEDRTVYARTGDLVAYASLVVSLAAVPMGRRRAQQTSRR